MSGIKAPIQLTNSVLMLTVSSTSSAYRLDDATQISAEFQKEMDGEMGLGDNATLLVFENNKNQPVTAEITMTDVPDSVYAAMVDVYKNMTPVNLSLIQNNGLCEVHWNNAVLKKVPRRTTYGQGSDVTVTISFFCRESDYVQKSDYGD